MPIKYLLDLGTYRNAFGYLFRRIFLLFNQSTQYLTHSGFTPTGVNFEIKASYSPSSAAIGVDVPIFGDFLRKDASNNLVVEYTDTGAATQTITLSPRTLVADQDYQIVVSSDGNGVEVIVNGINHYSWLPTGSSYITAPTLGNLLSMQTVKVTCKNVYWDSNTYLFSQAGALTGSREFGFFRANVEDIAFFAGGISTTIGTASSIFGSSVIDVSYLTITFDFSSGAYSIFTESGLVLSGVAGIGAGRSEGVLFRIGARANDDISGSTSGSFISPATNRFGDVDIVIDEGLQSEKSLSYKMPSLGTVIAESVQGNDGTLQNPGGNDWLNLGLNSAVINPSTLTIDNAMGDGVEYGGGKIWDIEYNDIDTPSNSREYKMDQASAIQPNSLEPGTNDATIVNYDSSMVQ